MKIYQMADGVHIPAGRLSVAVSQCIVDAGTDVVHCLSIGEVDQGEEEADEAGFDDLFLGDAGLPLLHIKDDACQIGG